MQYQPAGTVLVISHTKQSILWLVWCAYLHTIPRSYVYACTVRMLCRYSFSEYVEQYSTHAYHVLCVCAAHPLHAEIARYVARYARTSFPLADRKIMYLQWLRAVRVLRSTQRVRICTYSLCTHYMVLIGILHTTILCTHTVCEYITRMCYAQYTV